MPPPIAGVDGNWACQLCGNVNFPIRYACNRCQAPKPADADQQLPANPGGPPMAGVDGNWQCPFCQNVNFAIRHQCNRCQAPRDVQQQPPPTIVRHAPQQTPRGGKPIAGIDGAWECTQCGNVNFGVRTSCNRCAFPRQDQPSEDAFEQLFAQEQLAGGLAEFVAPAAPQWPSQSGRKRPEAGVDGNWACDQCGNVNFPVRFVCNKCQAPKPNEAAQHAPPQFHKHTGGGGAPIAGIDGNWMCPHCQNVNFPLRTSCNRCAAPKPGSGAAVAPPLQPSGGGLASPRAAWPAMIMPGQRSTWDAGAASKGAGKNGAPVAGVDGNWACPQCGNVNYGMRPACNRCQTPKPDDAEFAAGLARKGGTPVAGVDGNWLCPICNNVNFPVRQFCNRCKGPKPEEGAGHGHGSGAAVDYSKFAYLTDDSDLTALLADHPELGGEFEPEAKRVKH